MATFVIMGSIVVIAVLTISSNCFLNDDTIEELGKMSRYIALRNFAKFRCLVVLTEDSDNILDYIHPIDIPVLHVRLPLSTLKESERLTPAEEFEEYTWEPLILGPMDAGCLAVIVQTSDIKFMVKTFARLAHSPKSIFRSNRKYLYLPTEAQPDDDFEEGLKDLFSLKEMDFMPDLVVTKLVTQENVTRHCSEFVELQAGNNTTGNNVRIELITHRFVGPIPSERVSLDVWVPNRGFLHNVELYPDKVTNLMGKAITKSAILYPPFTAVCENGTSRTYDGMEFRFMKEWAKYNNFTLQVLYRPGEWWGEVWNNGSGIGLSGLVSMDLADVSGSIYLWENPYPYTDFSTAFTRTSCTIVLPKPKLLPGWMVPIHPFALDMWVAVGSSVLVSAVVLYTISQSSMRMLGDCSGEVVVNMYSTWVECAFRTLGILVLQVPPDERDYSTPRYVPMRHLVTWLILFYFVVTTAYGGGLSSVLTIPRYEKPIETASDMAERDVVWGANSDVWVLFMRDSSDPNMLAIAKKFVLESEEHLMKKATAGGMGFPVERMQGGNFALLPYVNEFTMQYLRVMKEDYDYGNVVFSLRKGSPFLSTMNSMLKRSRDAGLFLIWEYMTVRMYMSTRDQLSVISSRKDEDPGPTKLQLQHVAGSFYILVYGLVLAVVVFCFELLRHRRKINKMFEEKENSRENYNASI